MSAATLVVALAGLGEMLAGVIIVAFPREVALLLVDVALDARAILVARMLGCAAFSIGLTWWMARADASGLSRILAGFIVYNAGIGVLFAVAAAGASRPAMPWLACAAHVAIGVAFAIALRRRPLRRDAP